QVAGHHRAVDHEQVVVAEDAEAGVDHAFAGVAADRAAAEDVGSGRDVVQYLDQTAERPAVDLFGQALGDLVGHGHVSGNGPGRADVGVQRPAEGPPPAAPQPQPQVVVDRLHHQQDGGAPGPAEGVEAAQE